MRRLLSAFMAFCLFNVSVYGAVAKLADEEVERQHYTVDVTPQQPHLQKSVYTSTKNLVFGLQAKTFEYLKSIHYFIKSHPIIWIPLAIVSITALHISIISIVMDCILGTFPGSSISPNFEGIYYWFTHSSNHYKVLDYTPDYSQASALQSVLVQRDSWKATPHLTLL